MIYTLPQCTDVQIRLPVSIKMFEVQAILLGF